MKQTFELEQEVIDAEEAKQILGSKAFAQIDGFVNEWVIAKVKEHVQDPSALQEVAMFAKAHEQYRGWFENIMETGKIASFELETIRDEEEILS